MTTNKTVSNSYISDVVYDSSYNQYLNPLNLHYVALHAGLRNGKLQADFRYCDLGCGNGTTLNMLASMFPQAQFCGVDFNQEHIAEARHNANSAELDNIEYHRLDFANLESFEIQPLDFINCFGTFSWINTTLQDSILKFAGRSLANCGIFTVHYAAKPGKVQIDSLWHLMQLLTNEINESSTERARAGVKAIGLLRKNGAQFFKENPVAHRRASTFTYLDLNNLAHEALSEWHTFHLSEIAGRTREHGLQYAGLQSPADNDSDMTIPDNFKLILDDYTDPVARASVEDYILNRGIRCDVYVKTTNRAASNAAAIARQNMWLTSPDGAIAQTITTSAGKRISLHSPQNLGVTAELRLNISSAIELSNKPALSSWSESDIINAISRLVACGEVKPVIGKKLLAAKTGSHECCQPTLAMTRNILRGHIPASGFIYLPSPLLGQCVPVDQVIGLSLSALLYHAGQEAIWVAEQISNAGVAGFQGTPTEISEKDTADIASKSLQMTVTNVLPALCRLGVYKWISCNNEH